jgi:hypothetical protein
MWNSGKEQDLMIPDRPDLSSERATDDEKRKGRIKSGYKAMEGLDTKTRDLLTVRPDVTLTRAGLQGINGLV